MTPERSRILAREFLGLGLVVLVFASWGVSLTRGLLFVDLQGVITDLETRHEKHPGIDDRHFVTVATDAGPRTLEVGSEVAARVRVGALLDTTTDASGFLLDGEEVVVTHPSEGWAVGLALACGCVVIVIASMTRAMLRASPRKPS